MTASASSAPPLVAALLDWPGGAALARLALLAPYAAGGLDKLLDWPAALAEQAHVGLTPPAPFAALTIAVEVIGPALALSRATSWLGCGMLGVFTALAACIANPFWSMTGEARLSALNAFLEHGAMIGGLILLVRSDRARAGRRGALEPLDP